LELLKRCGGIQAGAEPGSVYVLRPHVVEGRDPEVFHVDLSGIVRKKDPSTNLAIRPFDQVYVGERRQAVVLRCLPGWLQPLYKELGGMARPGSSGKAGPVGHDSARDRGPSRAES